MTKSYAVEPLKATSIAPPIGATASGRPLANVVTTPVLGSTRETLPRYVLGDVQRATRADRAA